MLGCKKQKPDDRLDYDIDFSRWLSDDDAITDASAVADAGLSVDSVAVFEQVVKVWISGGVTGKHYKVDVTASTSDGRVKEETFYIRIGEC